ncbi:hypothetical protein PsorP6_005966 [Peronosclerospora sorghi]|uniref:Uncharacterized protein n=1 Tax=Peronosclerospora sorghi TaxID=230839 RepID=A0ACC0W668_9STRA|nr:hypothetical protein PsorP6_005966 [Peronosclerospora sorghi]
MGCSQSKVNKIVLEPVTAPSSEWGKTSMDTFQESIVDETNKNVSPIEEEGEKREEGVVATAGEKPASLKQPVEVILEEPESITDANVIEAEAVEKSVIEEEEDAPIELEVQAPQEKSLRSDVTCTSTSVWTFAPKTISFTVGIAFFNIVGSNSDGAELHLSKRYSEFKVLHTEMANIMSEAELPKMPGTSFLQGRSDKAMLQERETLFVELLNAIAKHPEGRQSAPFTAFLV